MAISPNTRLGSYEVVAQIGAGGMGEVYKARDTKLGGEVAMVGGNVPLETPEQRKEA